MRLGPIVVRVALALCAAGPLRAQESTPGGKPNPASPVRAAEPAPASGGLGRIKDLFSAAAFADCATEAARVLAPNSPQRPPDAASLDKVRTFHAACLVLAGDVEAGRRAFEEAIRGARNEQRTFPRPNTLIFPAHVVGAYDQVYGRLEQEFRGADEAAKQKASTELDQLRLAEAAERRRQARVFELASRETVVTRNRRWVAVVPFGAGQFQNRKPGLGWIFAVSELAALGITLGGVGYELELHAKREGDPQTVRTVWTISGWTFLALGVGGMVEALINFVPEFREVRRRSIPPDLRPQPVRAPARVSWRIEPAGSVGPSGGMAGVAVRF